MNETNHGNARRKRARPEFRLAPATRAIRSALALSAAVLALSGSGVALAGTCSATGAQEVTCNGVFTDDVSNSIPLVDLVPDLTLIVGTDGSTTVDPAAGSSGITSTWGGDATVVTYAAISTTDADGVHMYSADGTASFYNYGAISTDVAASAQEGAAIGALYDVYAANGGSIVAQAVPGTGYGVTALYAYSAQGNVYVANLAGGTVYGLGDDGQGVGIYAHGYFSATVANYGDVAGVSANGAGLGIVAYALGAATIYNAGDISAYSGTSHSIGADAVSVYFDATVANAGDIHSLGVDYAGGALAASFFGSAGVYNSGNIDVASYASDGYGAVAATKYGGDATAVNDGAITVSAYGNAVGLIASANDGYSLGGDAYAGGTGSIDAYSAYGVAVGMAAVAKYGSATVVNAGDVSATGYYGAVGVQASSLGDAYVGNAGSIQADDTGAFGQAIGVLGISYAGAVTLVNDGDISASAEYIATGVSLRSDTYTYLYNTGSIEASGAAYNVAIDTSYGLSADYLYNGGTITGAIDTGDGDDFLYNADGAEWNPGTTTSYFLGGDDVIVNYGTINLDGSSIDLGTWSVNGNGFYNYGLITVNGAYNHIDMGGPQALVPSLNPNPFYNYGTIDFQDGNPNDYLLITGDFAGQGDINVDVSGLDEVSDVLYIDGSVVTGTVQTINVDLLDLPDSIEALIPIVYVTGNSVSGNFVLGEVDWDDVNTFVTLDFSIVADIDPTNATPDVFSLGIEVTGLSDPGTLAASMSGSVMSLMNSQVGTWRQRMGVIDNFNKGAVSLWARVFTDKGSFTPGHVAANFGQGGNFDFDQKNSGVEAGVDFAVTDEFSLGLLVAKSKAETHLDDPGVGHNDIDADTWGVYGTWISPNGFYLDASYRWMNFDVDLSSVAGPMKASGNAEAFNIEVGYAWTLSGGLKIEPQLQWTKTSVDSIDVVQTSTGMAFANDGGDSSRGRLGVAIRKSFGDADTGWLWTPYATISAVREFDGESSYAINNTFFGTTTIEGTSALLELGFTARHENWSVYGGLNWQDGGAVNSFFGGQLGVRYTFGGEAPPPPVPVVVAPAKTCADLDDDGDGVNNCDDKCLGSTAGQAVGADGCPVPAPEPEPVMEPKPYRN